jgi:hypothetical protein
LPANQRCILETKGFFCSCAYRQWNLSFPIAIGETEQLMKEYGGRRMTDARNAQNKHDWKRGLLRKGETRRNNVCDSEELRERDNVLDGESLGWSWLQGTMIWFHIWVRVFYSPPIL